jgi:hypothetical protein
MAINKLKVELAIPKDMRLDGFYDTKAIAKLLGVKPGWLSRLRSDRKGPPFRKLHKQVDYRLRDVLEWHGKVAVFVRPVGLI